LLAPCTLLSHPINQSVDHPHGLTDLSHTDYMTSSLSTVPYNQEQCESYLRLVRSLPESDRAEGYRNCVLARLWSEIDGNFFVNLRGEDTPRLSRIQRLLPEPTTQTPGLVGWVKSWMMLGSSEWYERMLGEMWVDKISYASHWRKFMSGMVGEWKLHAAWVSGGFVRTHVKIGN
jgi:hypothetical protein